MQTNTQITTAYHLRIVIYFKPGLSDIGLLPFRVALAENLIIHGFLRAFAGHDYLDCRHFVVLVCDVKGAHQLHKVFIWSVACRAEQKCRSIFVQLNFVSISFDLPVKTDALV